LLALVIARPSHRAGEDYDAVGGCGNYKSDNRLYTSRLVDVQRWTSNRRAKQNRPAPLKAAGRFLWIAVGLT